MMKEITGVEVGDQKLAFSILEAMAVEFPEVTCGFDPPTGKFWFDVGKDEQAKHGSSRANVYIIQKKLYGFIRGMIVSSAPKTKKAKAI